jgi:hypothetical protein
MYVVELSGSLITVLVHFITVYTVFQKHWTELMSQVCPSLMVYQVVAPTYGHMLVATKNKIVWLVSTIVPVLKSQDKVLLLTLENITTVKVLHHIALMIAAGTQTIPYGTMRTVIQEAIVVIPHVLLGL